MALEIQIDRFGGPEVLEARDVPPQPPRKDYAPLRAMPMPLVLGMEAAGVVEAVGEGVKRFRGLGAQLAGPRVVQLTRYPGGGGGGG